MYYFTFFISFVVYWLDKGHCFFLVNFCDNAFDMQEEKCCWMWKKPPPGSRVQVDDECDEEGNKIRKVRRQKKLSVKERLLKGKCLDVVVAYKMSRQFESYLNKRECIHFAEFGCLICHKVMVDPLTTPCAHNFCKACLEGAFVGQSFIRQRTCEGRRTLRAQKNIMKCPSCKNDISEFLLNPQVLQELYQFYVLNWSLWCTRVIMVLKSFIKVLFNLFN